MNEFIKITPYQFGFIAARLDELALVYQAMGLHEKRESIIEMQAELQKQWESREKCND